MNFSSGIFALPAAVLFLMPSPVEGRQDPLGSIEIVERVVAVVGDSIILMTELEEAVIAMEARGWARPTAPADLLQARLEILEQLVNQQLILQEAAKDSLLTVSEEELEDRVAQEIAGQVRQFGTLRAVQLALAEQNMTLAVYREQQKNLIRAQLLQERYFAKRGQDAADVIVTEAEVRAFFDENPALFPERAPTFLFENVQLQPESSDSAKAVALARADSVLGLIQEGGDFAELAARFSDGPSGQQGGDLGWMRAESDFAEEFLEAAFDIPAGGISIPVETIFGYHLILVERIRGGERRVRHIVFQPEILGSDIEANDARAQSFAARLNAGETMEDLGQEPDTADLSLEQIAQSSPAFAAAMQDAVVGDVVGPVPLVDARSANGWVLGRVLGTTSGGVPEFANYRTVIEERLRSEGLTATVIDGLRSRAFIDIRLGQR